MTELWYRINLFAEKRFFKKRKYIDGLIVPAHLIAYYEIAVPEFLKDLKLPFIVDPVTYLWELDPSIVYKGVDLKKSYSKFVEELDCKVASMLGKQRIALIKTDSSEFQDFVYKVLKFQLLGERIEETPRHHSMKRIKSYRKKETSEASTIQPFALVPPYFHFQTTNADPYDKTIQAAKLAKDSIYSKKFKIYPVLCMDKSILLDESSRNRIFEDFKHYSGIIFWINEFDETKAHQNELRGFVDLVSKFHEVNIDVIHFYGGYFSLMLSHIGLSKLSSGICYLRFKNVFAKGGGGGLPVRYYEPHLKIKLMGDDMFRLYLKAPDLFTCNCSYCSKFSDKYKTLQSRIKKEQHLSKFFGIHNDKRQIVEKGKIDWETSRLHFLYQRKMEQTFLKKNNLPEVISDLRMSYKSLQDNQVDPNRLHNFDSYDYLKRWTDCLEDKAKPKKAT